jgi:hypothetical protein
MNTTYIDTIEELTHKVISTASDLRTVLSWHGSDAALITQKRNAHYRAHAALAAYTEGVLEASREVK